MNAIHRKHWIQVSLQTVTLTTNIIWPKTKPQLGYGIQGAWILGKTEYRKALCSWISFRWRFVSAEKKEKRLRSVISHSGRKMCVIQSLGYKEFGVWSPISVCLRENNL